MNFRVVKVTISEKLTSPSPLLLTHNKPRLSCTTYLRMVGPSLPPSLEAEAAVAAREELLLMEIYRLALSLQFVPI